MYHDSLPTVKLFTYINFLNSQASIPAVHFKIKDMRYNHDPRVILTKKYLAASLLVHIPDETNIYCIS